MIIVQVENHEQADSSFLKSVFEERRPDHGSQKKGTPVPGSTGKFVKDRPEIDLRIYMSLRDDPVDRFYIKKGNSQDKSYVLCLDGLGASKARRRSAQSANPSETKSSVVEVVSEDVVKQLSSLLKPWGTVTAIVESDVATRKARNIFGEAKKTLLVSKATFVGSACAQRQPR